MIKNLLKTRIEVANQLAPALIFLLLFFSLSLSSYFFLASFSTFASLVLYFTPLLSHPAVTVTTTPSPAAPIPSQLSPFSSSFATSASNTLGISSLGAITRVWAFVWVKGLSMCAQLTRTWESLHVPVRRGWLSISFLSLENFEIPYAYPLLGKKIACFRNTFFWMNSNSIEAERNFLKSATLKVIFRWIARKIFSWVN